EPGGAPASPLSPQEARVASLAVTGATAREIAGQLHLSSRTVESHLAHVYVKLGIRSRAELRRRWADRAEPYDRAER
ncbi:MAG: helix-turn-helix domain-containing protein, partial [Acidimicrobiales bacterium]